MASYTIEHWGILRDPTHARPLVFSYGAGLDSFFVLTRLLEARSGHWKGLHE